MGTNTHLLSKEEIVYNFAKKIARGVQIKDASKKTLEPPVVQLHPLISISDDKTEVHIRNFTYDARTGAWYTLVLDVDTVIHALTEGNAVSEYRTQKNDTGDKAIFLSIPKDTS